MYQTVGMALSLASHLLLLSQWQSLRTIHLCVDRERIPVQWRQDHNFANVDDKKMCLNEPKSRKSIA